MSVTRLLARASTAAALLVATATLAACNTFVPPAGVKLLKEANEAYRQGDDSATVARTDEFLTSYSGTNAAGEAFYLRGLAKARQRDRVAARKDFEQALQSERRNDLVPLAQVALGNLLFEQWQLEPAAGYYAAAVDALPNQSPKDVVLYRLGQCKARLGNWRDARQYFSQVIHLFSDSPLEPAARRYFAADGYRIQCGAFSSFSNAHQQVEFLRQNSLQAEQRLDVNGRFHLVQVGHYDSYAEARSALRRVLGVVDSAIIVP